MVGVGMVWGVEYILVSGPYVISSVCLINNHGDPMIMKSILFGPHHSPSGFLLVDYPHITLSSIANNISVKKKLECTNYQLGYASLFLIRSSNGSVASERGHYSLARRGIFRKSDICIGII